MSIDYKTLIEREEMIAEALEYSETKATIKHAKNEYSCPEIMVDQKYLLYRIDNTRIGTDLPSYAMNNSLDQSFFSRENEENERVQNVIHELLEPYIKTLKETEQQQGPLDPIWILPNGRVVIGNRRLCYYRETDRSELKCIVLDNPIFATDEKVLEIEAEADMYKEDKVSYPWDAQGRNLATLRDAGKSYEEIRNLRANMTVNQIKVILQAYDGAKNFLELINRPDDWTILKGEKGGRNEQIWMDYAKKAKNSEQQEIKDLLMFNAGITTLVPTEVVTDRKYANHAKLIKDPEKFKDILNSACPDLFTSHESAFEESSTFDLDKAVTQAQSMDNVLNIYNKIEDEHAKTIDIDAESNRRNLFKEQLREAKQSLISAASLLEQYDDLDITDTEDALNRIKEEINKIENSLTN